MTSSEYYDAFAQYFKDKRDMAVLDEAMHMIEAVAWIAASVAYGGVTLDRSKNVVTPEKMREQMGDYFLLAYDAMIRHKTENGRPTNN